jgi:hypothetical protein
MLVVLAGTVAACGDEEMFALQLASNERDIHKESAAQIASDDRRLDGAIVVGDLDGDGIADAIISGAHVDPDPAPSGTYRVRWYVLYGGAQLGRSGKAGEGGDPAAIDPAKLPTLVTGLGDNPNLGGVAPAGDVDGDGKADVLIRYEASGCPAPGAAVSGDAAHAGAFLLYGSATRLEGTTRLTDAAAFLRDANPCTSAGWALGGLGDLDGDGKAEIAIDTRGGKLDADSSRVFVFYGRGERLSGTIDLAAAADAAITVPAAPLLDPSYVAAAGDVDGDGYDDFFTTSRTPDRKLGYVGLVRGGKARLHGAYALADVVATRFVGDRLCVRGSASALGDLDGDGAGDVAIYRCPEQRGTGDLAIGFHVFYGRAAGFPAQVDVADADAVLSGSSSMAHDTVGPLATGDVDGDGVLDLVLGDAALGASGGGVYVMHGPRTRLSGNIDLAGASTIYLGSTTRVLCASYTGAVCVAHQWVGFAAGVGDLTGDGRADVLATAPSDVLRVPMLGVHGASGSTVYLVSPPAVTN